MTTLTIRKGQRVYWLGQSVTFVRLSPNGIQALVELPNVEYGPPTQWVLLADLTT